MITRSDMTSIKSAVALAVMAVMGTVAHAEKIAATGFASGEKVHVEWDGWSHPTTKDIDAGLITIKNEWNTPFEAFCVELGQQASFTFKDYKSTKYDVAVDAVGSGLSKLFSSSFASVKSARDGLQNLRMQP